MVMVYGVLQARGRARRALVCQAGEAAVVVLPDLREGGRGDARFRVARTRLEPGRLYIYIYI